SVAAFHHANAERARRWPDAMLATATHDTKRGEDTRARLYALSELPQEWERQVQAWSRIARARRGGTEGDAPPERNDEYLFYQLLLGAWPAELTSVDRLEPETMAVFAERIEGAMIKSVREAKVSSSWAAPDEQYEEALKGFIRDCLDVSRSSAFLEIFLPFQARIARLGVLNSLAQLLLKLTVPGIPDVYQGSELWDLSLVDPDNRRPVDYDRRQALLEELGSDLERNNATMADLLENWQDGRVKLALMWQVLTLRRARPELFASGGYQPLETAGDRSDQLCAFARDDTGDQIIVAVPRLVAALDAEPDWGNTSIVLPPGCANRHWENTLTGAVTEVDGRGDSTVIRAQSLFNNFPVALLISVNESAP
ncbi:MAG: malto-oligosyltrehalose synthase, partial [Nitrococcus sp.]|nr:malto-oligosyltrehalose synthase [Nitrococcus sp.]